MRALLAMITCHTRQAYADSQRGTWLCKLPEGLDYRFFLGPSGRIPEKDEVFLDCDDSYMGLPSKVQAVCRWALEKGYDYIVKVDDDVILRPYELVAGDFQYHDFSGRLNGDRDSVQIPWGFCYTLSRRAMIIMADANLPKDNNDEAWCAHTLSTHGIVLHNQPRYCLHRGRREDFIKPTKRPLRAPLRPRLIYEGIHKDALAYCIFLHWFGYHSTSDEMNIREYHKLYKELTQ